MFYSKLQIEACKRMFITRVTAPGPALTEADEAGTEPEPAEGAGAAVTLLRLSENVEEEEREHAAAALLFKEGRYGTLPMLDDEQGQPLFHLIISGSAHVFDDAGGKVTTLSAGDDTVLAQSTVDRAGAASEHGRHRGCRIAATEGEVATASPSASRPASPWQTTPR
jgi:hypothetical protein